MKSTFIIFFWLIALLFFSCDNSTDPAIFENKLSIYDNHYKILFRRGFNFYTIHSDGTNLVQLTNTNVFKQEATWSPDESKVAFACGDLGDNINIYIMDSNGLNLLKLSQNPGWNINPKFTPDGTKVIYSSYLHLNSVNIDGTNHIELQTSQDVLSTDYCIHPSENKVLYIFSKIDSSYLYEFDISNSNERKIIEKDYFILDPVYSPDGLKIAYASNKDGQCEIFLTNEDGTGEFKLTNLIYPNRVCLPVWSPDNSKILFQYWDGINNGAVYQINSDGSNLIKIANYGRSQSWSPDMTRISYSVDTDSSSLIDTIFINDVETGMITKLTDGFHAKWSKFKL